CNKPWSLTMGGSMTELNYQELVEGYYDNLNNNLRNFKGGPGFLETWVHDEDHNRSLLEILDLAHEHGISELKIQLPKDVSTQVNLDWLRKNSHEFGSVDLKGQQLSFSNTRADYAVDEFSQVSELYVDGLKRQNKALRFEGVIETNGGQVFKAGDGGELAVALGDKGLVTEAKHKGFTGIKRPLMDALCGVLQGRSLHEGAEHCGIRLEAILRDPSKPVKVKGLLTPETADPMFALPQKLVRQIFADYVKTNKIEVKRNFWRDPVPAQWLDLPYETKLKEAQKVLNEGCAAFGLQSDVAVTEVKGDARFFLNYKQDKTKPDFGRHMIKLEHWLRNKLQFEVDLQLESIEDRNRREERTKRS
ncbi:MAG: hypothetical protein AB7H97_20280, partial [Pseudobdellovibrionaceae bacterium]